MKPGIYGVPDDVVEMTYAPGASRPSVSFELRQRVVRIVFPGGYRDILLEERQIYGANPRGIMRWIDRLTGPVLGFAMGALAMALLATKACV